MKTVVKTAIDRCLVLAAVCATAAVGSACDTSDLRSAVPRQAQLAINVPDEGAGQALRAGSLSELYTVTRDLSRSINGGVGLVFAIAEQILALPPTDTDNETFAIWGPSEPQGLERNSFRFTINKVVDGEFTYTLEARNKDATEDSDFATIWEGTSFPTADGVGGHGDLQIHFGALRAIDDSECAASTSPSPASPTPAAARSSTTPPTTTKKPSTVRASSISSSSKMFMTLLKTNR